MITTTQRTAPAARFYLTRDRDVDGNLSETIDVWESRPIRHRISAEGGYVWVPADRPRPWTRFLVQLSLAECRRRFATYPTDDAVCLQLAEVAR